MKRAVILLVLSALWLIPASTASASHSPGWCQSSWYDLVDHTSVNRDVWTETDTWGANLTSTCVDFRDGNDEAHFHGYIDAALGGPGNDELYMGDGGDAAKGEAGTDYIQGGEGQDTGLYGGTGADEIHGNEGADNIFGGEMCSETGYWGWWYGDNYDNQASSPNTAPCAYLGTGLGDGADVLLGGDGDDWLWDSNSDNGGDNAVDWIDGGAGNDDCTGEAIDTILNCETVHIIP